MRRLSLIIFLVCLMTSSVFAATVGTWGDVGGVGKVGLWSDPCMWKASTYGVPPPESSLATNEIKLTPSNMDCTINYQADYNCLVTVASGPADANAAVVRVVKGANFGMGDLRIGARGATTIGSVGKVYQTGGKLSVKDLIIGRNGTNTFTGQGYYTITGGTLQAKAALTGRMYVGSGFGNGYGYDEGTFSVENGIAGDDPNISMKRLYVGTDAGSTGASIGYGKGTLEFKIRSTGGVDPIKIGDGDNGNTDVYLAGGDADGTSSADLVLSLLSEPPPGVIVLVKQSDTADVNGYFDSISGDQSSWDYAKEGDYIRLKVPGGSGTWYYYMLTYKYDSGDGTANDIALVPEPATVALLGLGALLAVRRPRRR